MSLVIATGSNIGDSIKNLAIAQKELGKYFKLIATSRIYKSKAVDYPNQPDFFNQVLEFEIPEQSPEDVMRLLLEIEKKLGRTRDTLRGPRIIDLDILFWDLLELNGPTLSIPHPRWKERSFVVLPLKELPFFQSIKKCFTIPSSFNVDAFPV